MDIRLTNVRLSFPVLWEPKEYKVGDGNPRFSATLLIEPGSENDQKIREAIRQAAEEKYGKKAEANLKQWAGNSQRYCYLDGNSKDYEGYEGRWYLACHSRTRPTLVDRDRTRLVEEDGKLYGGCYVNAMVSIYAQAGENPGIRASFTGLQFAGKGDAFGGGKPADPDDFEDLGQGADAESMV